MAVLNVRVDDRVHVQLQEMAKREGLSLSEYVRELVMAATVPVYEQDAEHGDLPAPVTMNVRDRQVLSLLHRILARVLPKEGNDVDGDREYQLMRARILEEGFTGAYWYETAGFRTELSSRDCNRVTDILQMFRIITFSIDHFAGEGAPIDDNLLLTLEFRGFDHNDPLESHMAGYVEFQMGDDRWTELKPQLERNDNGNSHARMLGTYLRMLAEYRRIMDSRPRGQVRLDSYLLSREDLNRIAEAAIHPSNRRRP